MDKFLQSPLRWLLMGLLALLALGNTAVHAQSTPADDWARVQSSGRIVIGTAADYPPFEYYNSNFTLDGFDIALARALGKRLGVEVVFNDFAFGGLIDTLRLGQVDVVISALSVTPDRQQIVDFTNLYYVGEDALLVRTDFNRQVTSATDLAGLKLGVERGSTYQAWIQNNMVDTGLIAQTDLFSYDSLSGLIRDLRNGSIDAALMGTLTARITGAQFADLEVGAIHLNQQRYAIAARQGSSLIEPLNAALVAIQSDGTFAQLVSQYLQVPAADVTPSGTLGQVINQPVVETAPAAPAPCIKGMTFVADINLDDRGMTAPPVMLLNQDFIKGWRIRNTGTCDWTANYQMVYVSGNRPEAQMSGQPTPIGVTVPPGQTVDVSVVLRAPNAYGVFQGFWQLRDDTGQALGEVVWVGIQVPDPAPPPTPAPPPPAGINPNFRADNTWVNPGQCTTLRWDVDNINAVYLIDGNRQEGVGGHDARTVCPGQTWTFVLRVVDRNGANLDFPLTINVNGQPQPPSRPGPIIREFNVDRTEIRAGECVNLRWRVDDADGINLLRSGQTLIGGGGREGNRSDCPPGPGHYDYRLDAYGNGGQSQSIGVNVVGSGGGGRPRDE